MQDHLRSQQLPTERIFAIPPAYDQAALDDSLIAKNDRFAPPLRHLQLRLQSRVKNLKALSQRGYRRRPVTP